jgi:BlaI family penicillinase repressor
MNKPLKLPKISDAEWQVMNVIWNKGKTTSYDIVKQLESETDWGEMTIRTLIGRLVKKKVAGYEVDKDDKRIYYYYPIVDREQCVKEETNNFLKKFYNGALSSMLSSFVKKDQLSYEEVDELINILESGKNKEE